jgi:hypothetical protein
VYTTTALPCGSSHLISPRTVDLAGNRSPAQRFTAATDLPEPGHRPAGDRHRPDHRDALVAVRRRHLSGYNVYFGGGAIIGQTANPSFTVTGLPWGTAYSFSVRAVDSVGDRSARMLIPAATTPC